MSSIPLDTMNAANKSLRWSRRLSHVPRWSVAPNIRSQNVAEHTFHVARTAMWLADICGAAHGKYTAEPIVGIMVIMALDHDDDEAAHGDMPGTSKPKKDYSQYQELAMHVKIADLLEAYLFVEEELRMGNSLMNGLQQSMWAELQEAYEHFRYMDEKPKIGINRLVSLYLDAALKCHPALEVNNETA